MKRDKTKWTDLGEGGGTRSHKNLSNTIVESLKRLVVDPQETLRCSFLCYFVLKVPYAVPKQTQFKLKKLTKSRKRGKFLEFTCE